MPLHSIQSEDCIDRTVGTHLLDPFMPILGELLDNHLAREIGIDVQLIGVIIMLSLRPISMPI